MQLPEYTKVHNRFRLNGFHYNREGLKEVAYSFIKEGDQFERFLGDFLMDWLDASDSIFLETSGTTASPKRMAFKKQALVNSAIATGDFFNVSVGDTALHCLPANFIAGKMMLIRAMILGFSLDLVSPARNPFHKNQKAYDFVAMTPMQAYHSLSHMDQIKTLIVGGAPVSIALQKALLKSGVKGYETYGMTETLSHIAVRTMRDPLGTFQCLPHIKIHQDERGCLVVNAPLLDVVDLVTNDQIEIINTKTFRLIGRVDNVINSGGVKLHPEQIEQKLAAVLSHSFFIGSLPDPTLGEKVILALKDQPESPWEAIAKKIKTIEGLTSYERPKTLIVFSSFVETHSGKVKRDKTLALKPLYSLDL